MSRLCLVVGGKGFIGSHLTSALLEAGWAVRILDRPGQPFAWPVTEGACEYVEGNFCDSETIRKAMQGCEYCFHLASTTTPKSSNEDPIFDVSSNLVGTIGLLNAAKDCGVRKVIFSSSGGTIYGSPRYTPLDEDHPTNPTCSYGITKLAAEKYLSLYKVLHGLDFVILRLSNPFGEGQRTRALQGAVSVFLGKCLRGEVVDIWGDGSVVRDYLYIADVVDALILAMKRLEGETTFNVGSAHPMSLLQLLDSIEEATGKSIERRFWPARPFDVPVNVLAIDRAREILGWAPKTAFLDGIARTARWLSERPQA